MDDAERAHHPHVAGILREHPYRALRTIIDNLPQFIAGNYGRMKNVVRKPLCCPPRKGSFMPLVRLAAKAMALVFVLSACGAAARAEEPLKISIPVMNASFAPFFIAADKGYFREEGLAPQFLPYSGGVSIPALIGGSLDASASPFTATIAIMKGAKLTVVLVTADRTADQLWSFDPNVRTIKNLRDKIIAVASRGNSEEINIRRVLAENGLGQNSVGFSAMGVGSTRLSSVISGAQRFSILNPLELDTLRKNGVLQKGTMLFDFAKGFETANGGIVVRSDDLSNRRDRIKGLVRATWKGMLYAESFRAASLALMEKRFPNVAPDTVAVDFDSMLATLNAHGDLSPQAEKEELIAHAEALAIPMDKIPDAEQVYDFSLLQQVQQELSANHWSPKE